MAFPGYLGFIWMKGLEAGIFQPATNPVNAAPPWTVGNIVSPGGSPAILLAVRVFRPAKRNALENTAPTGVFGARRNTKTGHEIAFHLELEFPSSPDAYASDLPDLENTEFAYADAYIGSYAVTAGAAVVYPPTGGGVSPTSALRSRRFKGYLALENIDCNVDAQGVTKFSFDAFSEGPYYYGPWVNG